MTQKRRGQQFRTGEAQWLRAHSPLPEILDLISSTYTAAHKFIELQFQGIQHPLRPSITPTTHVVHTPIYR